ncbi:MAG: CheR family methyltransferase [Porticoccaceae bacterium]
MSTPFNGDIPILAPSLLDRELVLTDADFASICQLIYRRAGIVLSDNKRQMVYSRLARRVKQLGFTRFSDYVALLGSRVDDPEWEAFVNALTTNLTAFFRESHHFTLLAEHLAERKLPVRVWSCAASTGEEPYSIAIVLREVLGDHANARVVATDIDTDALERARRAIYPQGHVAKVSEERVRRFFLKGRAARSGAVRLRPEVAAMVDFGQLNLIAPTWPLDGPFDAIFCRNVMIYFDHKTQARILSRFVHLLKPGGLLFAGHAENFSYISDAFRLRGQTVYTLARR